MVPRFDTAGKQVSENKEEEGKVGAMEEAVVERVVGWLRETFAVIEVETP